VPISFVPANWVLERNRWQGSVPFPLGYRGQAILTPDAVQSFTCSNRRRITHGSCSGSLSDSSPELSRISIGSSEIKERPFVVSPLQYTISNVAKKSPLSGHSWSGTSSKDLRYHSLSMARPLSSTLAGISTTMDPKPQYPIRFFR